MGRAGHSAQLELLKRFSEGKESSITLYPPSSYWIAIQPTMAATVDGQFTRWTTLKRTELLTTIFIRIFKSRVIAGTRVTCRLETLTRHLLSQQKVSS